jgi:ferredoxin-thioredoxin reductase catalytic subunit
VAMVNVILETLIAKQPGVVGLPKTEVANGKAQLESFISKLGEVDDYGAKSYPSIHSEDEQKNQKGRSADVVCNCAKATNKPQEKDVQCTCGHKVNDIVTSAVLEVRHLIAMISNLKSSSKLSNLRIILFNF